MNTVTRGEQARQFYNAAATTASAFSFMNYGFGPLIPELDQSADPERYCLQLYRHLLGDAQLAGRRVVEVSCGRGGGAAHLAHVYRPAEYIGIDISEQNVGLASRRFDRMPNLRFMVGNAEALPLEDASCDALVNVEASHLYDDPARFFREAFRVLKPGATFFHADLAWKDKDPAAMIGAAGFTLQSVEDITRNVLRFSRRGQRAARKHRGAVSAPAAVGLPRLVGREGAPRLQPPRVRRMDLSRYPGDARVMICHETP